jgi:uncharacterized protein (DUF952 family)
MRIFHIATRTDWQTALRSGSYTTSTRGRSLEQEGFIHAAHLSQVPAVHERYYADVTEPLVVLEIDTDLLDVPWQEDEVGEETFPHVYGPLRTSAVVDVRPAPAARASGLATHSPPPSGVAVFHGLAVVLGIVAGCLFFTGLLAHHQATTSLHSDALLAAQFVLWSLTVTSFVAALASWGVGNAFLNDHRNLTRWSESA